jgi:hypothetical protein
MGKRFDHVLAHIHAADDTGFWRTFTDPNGRQVE